jgi:hypothetical protein
MKALLSLIVVLMCLIFLACDDDGGTSCIPNRELELSACLAQDLFHACNRYFCEEIAAIDEAAAIIPPDSSLGEECVALNCQTISCGSVSYNELRIMNVNGFPGIFGIFSDDVVDTPDIEFGPCEFE